MGPGGNSDRIAASQLRALASACACVAQAAFQERRPADRALADFLRQHREFGGRDRRLLGDAIFGLLRWWGWLRTQVPAAADATPEAWIRLWLAVALLERWPMNAGPVALWGAACGLTEAGLAALAEIEEPAERVAALLGQAARSFQDAQLLPDWVPAAMACPRPDAELITWLQSRPPIWLRAQTEAIDALVAELARAGLRAVPHARLPSALRLDPARANLQTIPAYREGRVEVQDVSAQAVVQVCGAQAGERWLDLCAGGGGKTLALAQAVGATGQILATDIRAASLDELRKRARRAGLRHVRTAAVSTSGPLKVTACDGVLVDAPCTGSGTWRRSPWARWQIAVDEVARFATRQLDLLSRGAGVVRPGGVLVYATCSMLSAENRAVVRAFLDAHREFALEPCLHPLTGVATDGLLDVWPWDADGDAMFAARLRRTPLL